MYDFNYVKPASLDEALSARSSAEDGVYLAGGQTLIPTLKQRLARPSDVIDISALVGLRGVKISEGAVRIGAMTRHAEVADSADIAHTLPALADLAGQIGDPQIRNRGTLGGSLANSDPAADYPAAVLGLGATVHTSGRDIAADAFFLGMFETALEDGEIVTGVSFPIPSKAAYMKFPNPASRYAIVGVFVAAFGDAVRVAVTGAGACAFRVSEMEAALARSFSPEAVAGIRISAGDLNSDIHASADYRAHLVTVMAKRAVKKAG